MKKTLESPLDCKEVKPVNPKGNQSLVFIGRTIAEAEAPILWPPDVKNQLIGKDPDAGKDWRQIKREQQNMRCLDSTTDSMDVNLSRLREIVEDRGAWCAVVRGVPKSQTQLSNWTTTATNWEGAMADRMCQKCFVKFCAGDFLLDHAPQLGRPLEIKNY